MAVTVLTSVPVSAHLAVLGLWGRRFQLFLTVAGLVAVITAVLAGAAAGVLAATASDPSLAIWLTTGALTGLLVLTALTRIQQSNADQQISFRNRWSSSTSSRIASGSWSRCHRHSHRPAASPSPSGAAARAALIA